MAVRRWWGLDPSRRATGTPAEWEQQFRELFTDAVRIRLRADVEVGSCLSGGIDSSAVVTTAARLMDRPIHAFTCAYDEPGFDERAWVRSTVEASGATSHVVVPDGGDFWRVFDRLALAQDEPTAGPGVWSQWKVMDLAHGAGLRVLLDGQGGDETLAGYRRYLPMRLRDLLARGRFPAFLSLFGPTAARLGATHTLALALEPWLPPGVVAPLRRAFGQGKDRILSEPLRALGRRAAPPRPPAAFPSALSRQLAFDTLQRLLPSLLRYEDRNSMAFSIETRLPFLDYRMVELAFSLPDEQKLDGVTTKAIMRRALADRIPRAVLERTDKMGFETPADPWLRTRYAGEVRRRLLTHGPLHDWVDRTALEAELEAWLSGRRDIGLQIWRWLALESWARQLVAVDPRVIERPPEIQTHPGLHKSYVQVMEQLERDGGGPSGVPAAGVAAG
jgi:asparagine synthase (glutamine-hydrolysing)